MRKLHGIVALLSVWPVTAALAAGPLRAARSDNGRLVLKVDCGRPDQQPPKPCRATLLAKGQRGKWERRWSHDLVNAVAPLCAAVRDDGRYVATFDDYPVAGARHAVVIYGAAGVRLAEIGLAELLTGDDWRHVRATRQAVRWLNGARIPLR